MITRQELEGHWNELKGQIQQRWGGLNDDELLQARGSTNELIGLIQQRTGESRRAIEDFLEEAISGGGTMVQQAVETAREYAERASENAREYAEHARQTASRGYEQAQRVVRHNPLESVAVSFGAGMIAGIITGLVLKSSR